jgi:hypothetical protein
VPTVSEIEAIREGESPTSILRGRHRIAIRTARRNLPASTPYIPGKIGPRDCGLVHYSLAFLSLKTCQAFSLPSGTRTAATLRIIEAICRHWSEQNRRGSILSPLCAKRTLHNGLSQTVPESLDKDVSTACTLAKIDERALMASYPLVQRSEPFSSRPVSGPPLFGIYLGV